VTHDGYFPPDSMLRRVISETLVGLSGPQVLLLQAAHPVAWAGFFAHTGALDAPYERLDRTALIMNTVAFGTKANADRATRRVRAMHGRVSGTLDEPAGRWPAGTPYSAADPELLLWILGTLAATAAETFSAWVRRLDDDELERLWQDYRVVGVLFGLPMEGSPPTWEAFQAYWDRVLAEDLHVLPQARELAVDIVLHPPVNPALRPALELVNQITIGSLPPVVREMYGFSWDPVRAAALAAGREYVKRVVRPLLPDPLRRIEVARNGLPIEQQRRAAALKDRANVAA
jgi:uncharacterized protein (DUF2236 family)